MTLNNPIPARRLLLCLAIVFFISAFGLSGCEKAKPRITMTQQDVATIENTCAYLQYCAGERDWGMFYEALHPEIRDMVTMKKFIIGMKTHGKFARLIRDAEYLDSRNDGTMGIAKAGYKGHQYDIVFRRDTQGWKIYMDEDDLIALEDQIVANSGEPN